LIAQHNVRALHDEEFDALPVRPMRAGQRMSRRSGYRFANKDMRQRDLTQLRVA
jgi:hypothetical protein